MAVALEQFVKQLTDSGVIAPGKLENFLPPKATPKDAQELARQLVQSKHLTKFQAGEIYQGRAKSLILGSYTILDKIGAGGMGQVFKAQHRRMDRIVAIKMLPKHVMKDAATVARFEREVRAAAKLEHPNIVTAYDADEASGLHFLVMQFADGQDLSALVKANGPFPINKAVNYILQAARGLEFAHGEGVIHRDIKPANLLLDKKGTVKILDMGLARIEAGGDAGTQAELTGTGAVMGTVDYMAPEQALDTKHADARADIYSLGCTLFYLLTGKPMYEAETLTAKLLAHQGRPIPELRKIRDEVPEEVEAVYRKMVAKTVEDRYQAMSEVVAALESFGTGQQTSISDQQSISTNADNDAFTFLRDVPVHTANKPKPAKKSAQVKTGKSNRKFVLGAVGAGLVGLAVLAGVILKLKTKDGTLVVEIDQPDAVVQVLNEEGKVEITRPGEKGTVSISVDPGKHRLKIEKDGFDLYGEEFEIEKGGKQSIAAKLIPLKWNTPEFQKWVKEVASLSAEQQVEEVTKKLVELNPGFDGKVERKIEGHLVTELYLPSNNRVADISPVRALKQLKSLLVFSMDAHGPLSDLSPLKGIPLEYLRCSGTQVSDLSPLTESPLSGLNIESTRVSDLSSLGGMRLNSLECSLTRISDLSLLKGMNLRLITFTPKNITKGIDVIRQMKSLNSIGIEWEQLLPPDEFWQKYDAGDFGKPDSTPATRPAKPITTYKDPAFKKWEKEVAKLTAEQQVEAVAKKLQELNPGFDGKVTGWGQVGRVTHETPQIETGVVTEFGFVTDNVTDVSPLRALSGLKRLKCKGSGTPHAKLSDLSPLKGLQLLCIDCSNSNVFDLSPLQGMPLTWFSCTETTVTDLSPLAGMSLTELWAGSSPISDLTPLKNMPLRWLAFDRTHVSDLSPLQGMSLERIFFTFADIAKGMDAIRQMKSLAVIGTTGGMQWPPAEFWKKYDAGDFGKPSPPTKPITNINSPAFKKWMKEVAALPAEEQVQAVAKKLMELNPGFDGKEEHKIENGMVISLHFSADAILDISPARALPQLREFVCSSNFVGSRSKFADISPLEGMPLTNLNIASTSVVSLSSLQGMRLTSFNCDRMMKCDLSPLRGMPLEALGLENSDASDLSPLKGMPLKVMGCAGTSISDLSPLEGMPLTQLDIHSNSALSDLSPLGRMKLEILLFTPRNITKGIDLIRQVKSIQKIGINWQTLFPPDEFWKKYDAGEFKTFNDPAFKKWEKDVAKLPAEEQVKAVAKKLMELNPGFDGKVTNGDGNNRPQIENGIVTELRFVTDNVTDISPLRALSGLQRLICIGSTFGQGRLSDLSPLQGIKLTLLKCTYSQISDLTPLKGMPLKVLDFGDTKVTDLTPIKGMQLRILGLGHSSVADLSTVRGMPLEELFCNTVPVADLSPLQGMNLSTIYFTPENITNGLDVIRQMKSLKTIGLDFFTMFSPEEFWRKYDAGEFNK